jgi:hypothetical protein
MILLETANNPERAISGVLVDMDLGKPVHTARRYPLLHFVVVNHDGRLGVNNTVFLAKRGDIGMCMKFS